MDKNFNNYQLIEKRLKFFLSINLNIQNIDLLIDKFENDLYFNIYDLKFPIIYKIDIYNYPPLKNFFNIKYKEEYILEIIRIVIKHSLKNKSEQKKLFKKLKKLFYLEKKKIIFNLNHFYKNFNKDILKNIFFNYYKYCKVNKNRVIYTIFFEILHFIKENKINLNSKDLIVNINNNTVYIDIKNNLKKHLNISDKNLKKLIKIEKKFKF